MKFKRETELIDVSDKRNAFVVFTNTDLTEGRGAEYPVAVCDVHTTARRIAKGKGVMGTDASVYEAPIFRVGGQWYGPINIVPPSDKELKDEQERLEKIKRKAMFDAVVKKAKDLGLSDNDIAALNAGAIE